MTLQTPRRYLPVLFLTLTAFAVRVQGLGAQSLWHDEGASLYYALLGPRAAIEQIAGLGEIPPLYYVTLHYWLGLAGLSEFAVRFPSAWWGTLAVPLVYALGRRLGGSAVGLAAGFFIAVSPLHVWQSQEARMYTAVVALSAISVYLMLRLLAGAKRRYVIAYAIVAAAGLYTHFTFALIVLAQAVYLALWLPLHRAALVPALKVALGAGTAAALFLPWLGVGLSTYATGTTYWPGRLDVLTAGQDTLSAFVQGEYGRLADAPTLALVTCVALVLGLTAALLSGRRDAGVSPALLLTCYLVVPAAILAYLLLDRPKYGPRYLLAVLPAFSIAAGWAVAALPAFLLRASRRATPTLAAKDGGAVGRARAGATAAIGAAGLVVGLALFGASLLGLQGQASDPGVAREDFRGAAAYLAEQATADDAIILLGGHIQLPFLHYYRNAPRPGQAPVYPLPDTLMPAVATPIQAQGLAVLNDIVPGKRRVWVLRWQDELADPGGMVVRQVELAGSRLDPGRAFHGLHLEAFAVQGNPRFPIVFAPRVPVGASFANGLTLLGYDLTPERPRPGDMLSLTLFWRVESHVSGDLVAFTQLLNAGEHIYAQHDKPPVSELYKTSQWSPGDLLKDAYNLRVRPGTPPGEYGLQMGLYDRATMERIKVSASPGGKLEDRLLLATLAVDPGPPTGAGADSLRHAVDIAVAPEARLLGYEVEQEELRPGDTARIALLWLASGGATEDRHVYLALRAPDGREVARVLAPPADGTYPLGRWRANELVRDVQNLPLGPLAPGGYELVVGLAGPGQTPTATARLGTIEVR